MSNLSGGQKGNRGNNWLRVACISLMLGLLSEGHTQNLAYISPQRHILIFTHIRDGEMKKERERGEVEKRYWSQEDWWRLHWILMRGTITSSAAWRSLLQQEHLLIDRLLCFWGYINACLQCVEWVKHYIFPFLVFIQISVDMFLPWCLIKRPMDMNSGK